MEFLTSVLHSEMLKKIAFALILLVIGILAIRILGKILKKALEKSHLEREPTR